MIYKFEDKFPSIHESCFIAESADIIGEVIIEEGANIWFGTVIRADGQAVLIGRGTNIQDNCTIHINDFDYPTKVGKYVTVGHNVVLHGCSIGDYSLIGMGSIILDGAQVGDYSIVGAGSLIPQGKIIPSGVLCMGSPARVIRELTDEEKWNLELSAKHYIEFAKKYK